MNYGYMTESDIIIEYLLVIGRGEVVLYDHTFSAYMQTIKAYGLIVFEGKVPHISKEGYEVLKLGSFDKWLAAKEQKEAEIHKATIATAKATVDAAISAKWSQYAAITAAIAAVATIIIPTDNKPPEIRPDPVLSAM